MLYILLYIIL